MLNSWRKHSLFHFHPLHNLYSLIMALILFGLDPALHGDAGTMSIVGGLARLEDVGAFSGSGDDQSSFVSPAQCSLPPLNRESAHSPVCVC